MNSQKVADILGECQRRMAEGGVEGSVEMRQEFTTCRGENRTLDRSVDT